MVFQPPDIVLGCLDEMSKARVSCCGGGVWFAGAGIEVGPKFAVGRNSDSSERKAYPVTQYLATQPSSQPQSLGPCSEPPALILFYYALALLDGMNTQHKSFVSLDGQTQKQGYSDSTQHRVRRENSDTLGQCL